MAQEHTHPFDIFCNTFGVDRAATPKFRLQTSTAPSYVSVDMSSIDGLPDSLMLTVNYRGDAVPRDGGPPFDLFGVQAIPLEGGGYKLRIMDIWTEATDWLELSAQTPNFYLWAKAIFLQVGGELPEHLRFAVREELPRAA